MKPEPTEAQEDAKELAEVDLGTEAPKQTLKVSRYDEQMRRLVTQRLDIPVPSLATMIQSGQINLNPQFQRRGRWDSEKKSRFIESILMNVPLPPVFLGEADYGKYEVLDGRQRLTATYEYLTNQFGLSALKVFSELNESKFQDLKEHRVFIERRFIPTIVILRESSSEIKYDVFDRLNTGGVVLSQMEIRNALCRGGFSDTILELSGLDEFRRLWGIPATRDRLQENPLYRKMTDLELVLRFFALQDYASFDDKQEFKDFLTDALKKRNDLYQRDSAQKAKDVALFTQTVHAIISTLGDEAFRKSKKKRKAPRSAPLADAIMYAFSKVDPSSVESAEVAARIQEALQTSLKKDRIFVAAISKGTNGRTAIEQRLERTANLVRDAVRPPPPGQVG